MKSVSGFRVRLGNPDLDFENLNPDFPIERTHISLSIQKYLKKLNYFLLEAGDKFECQKRQFHGTFNLYNHEI